MCKRKKEQESPVRDSMLVGQVKQYRLAQYSVFIQNLRLLLCFN